MQNKKELEKFCDIVADEYDGALITPGSNLYYLTGLDPKSVMERLFVYIVYPDRKKVLISPKLYEDEVEDGPFDEAIFWGDNDDPFKIFKEYLEDITIKKNRLLIEDNMDASILMKIQNFIKDFELIPISSKTTEMRVTKSEGEIKYLKKAAQIVDMVFDELVELEFEGKSEKELVSIIDNLIMKNGADDTAFDTIVASGKNSANPHHSPTDKIIHKGDMVIMDYGAKYKGYCSDITRTVAVNKCPEQAVEIYEIVKKANEKAFQSVKENTKIKNVDLSARKVIEDAEYGEYFPHRVGHGIGLEAHEEPYMTSTNEKKLIKGMTFTIEPGIYISDKFGVRIEDDIVVQKEGLKLTKSKRNLIYV
ncbi:MAG: M24 family metallopeptidase [Thermoplasmata archaeon]